MISVCMIVRDEAANLPACLAAVRPFADEIVVTDTGSRDETKEIARAAGCRVFDFAWSGDFSQARNGCVSHAQNDWVLSLDADQTVTRFDGAAVAAFTGDPANEKRAGRILSRDVFDAGFGETHRSEWNVRLFNRRFFHFSGSIHEQVTADENAPFETVDLPVEVAHAGYRKEVMAAKAARNRDMLKKALKSDWKNPYLQYQMGKSLFSLGENEQACRHFEKALAYLPNRRLPYAADLAASYGYALVNCRAYPRALKLESLRGEMGANAEFLFMLGYVYMNNALFDKAVETFLACTRCPKGGMEGVTDYLPYYNIGVICECLGDGEQARRYYGACGGYPRAQERLRALA